MSSSFLSVHTWRRSRQSQQTALRLCLLLGGSGLLIACLSTDPMGRVWDARWVVLVGVIANVFTVRADRRADEIDTASGFIPMLLAAVSFSPMAAAVTAVVSSIPHLLVRPGGLPRYGRCVATRLFSGVIVATAFQSIHTQGIEEFLLAAFACAVLYQTLQLMVTTLILSFERGGDPLHRLRVLGEQFMLAAVVFGPMTVAFAYLITEVPKAVLLAAFVASFSHQMLVRVSQSRALTQMLGDMSVEVPGALLAALDAADSYTAQHSASVAAYSYDISLALGHDHRMSRLVHAAALLHDIGKIGVPDSVLTKAGRLDKDEWLMMRSHPETGANIVRHLPGFYQLEPGIMHHHERLDGTGYPAGLDASDIPIEARIIAVADTYSAITTTRSYQKARTTEFAISEMTKDVQKGLLDGEVVDRFIGILRYQTPDYREGRHTSLRREVERVRGWIEIAPQISESPPSREVDGRPVHDLHPPADLD